MPLIVDTDRRATCWLPLKTSARLRYESSMNKVWWEQILHESLEDGSWWMKNMLGARKHSNISPFMILRTVKNFRRLNKELARCARKYYMEKSIVRNWGEKTLGWNLRYACFHWWNAWTSLEKAKFRMCFVTCFVVPRLSRKRCVQCVKSIQTAITFRLRWETMSTDMLCCHTSFSIINETP